jgi:hypothetical protein
MCATNHAQPTMHAAEPNVENKTMQYVVKMYHIYLLLISGFGGVFLYDDRHQ